MTSVIALLWDNFVRPYQQLLVNFDLPSTIRDHNSKVEIQITSCIQRVSALGLVQKGKELNDFLRNLRI
jgi:hypothetical protein